jgi:hypothetical protein
MRAARSWAAKQLLAIGLMLLPASCAHRGAPVRYPARPGPAGPTVESDESLTARGYVRLGVLDASVAVEQCRGGQPGAAADCRAPAGDGDPTRVLFRQAATRGADLVRVEQNRLIQQPWTEAAGCQAGK